MTTKPPTPQGISALLRKAGFQRSVSSSTAIKGWRNHSRGYRVFSGYEPGEVRVEHESGMFRPGDPDRERASEELERYAEAIKAAGYEARKDDSPFGFKRLIVTAPKEG